MFSLDLQCVLCAPKIQEYEGHKRCTKNTKNNLCFAYTHAPNGEGEGG